VALEERVDQVVDGGAGVMSAARRETVPAGGERQWAAIWRLAPDYSAKSNLPLSSELDGERTLSNMCPEESRRGAVRPWGRPPNRAAAPRLNLT
jgi:muconolactone delta-isomerase